jgi:hypothetical protein
MVLKVVLFIRPWTVTQAYVRRNVGSTLEETETSILLHFWDLNFSQRSYQYNLYSKQRTNIKCIYVAAEKAQMQVEHSVCFSKLKDVKYA